MGRSGINGNGRAGGGKAKGIGNMKIPGGRFGYRMKERRDKAEFRTNERAQRSPQDQLSLLDQRLGKGEGARKERARLHAEIENNNKKAKKPKEDADAPQG
jgi:topoisomerase IA-like protein